MSGRCEVEISCASWMLFELQQYIKLDTALWTLAYVATYICWSNGQQCYVYGITVLGCAAFLSSHAVSSACYAQACIPPAQI